MLFVKKPRDISGGRLARVAGVRLEREAEHRDLLVCEGVEHRLEKPRDDALLLVVVHLDDARPVFRRGMKPERLAEIDEVQYVLLEAAAAETGTRLEELGADSPVRAHHAGDLVDICASRLAKPRKRIH